MTLGRISERAAVTPDDLALTDGTATLSWRELEAQVLAVATRLQGLPGDARVGATGVNAVPTLVAHLAGLYAGVGTVAVHRQASAGDLHHELVAAGCAALVLGPDSVDAALGVVAELGVVAVLHGGDLPAPASEQGWARWSDWLGTPVRPLRPRSGPAAPPLVYTSGTTGRAKATPVRWTGPQDAVTTERYVAALGARSGFPDGPHLVVGPLQHNGPLTSIRHLVAGQPVVVLPRFDPAAALERIRRHRVTSTVMVPTHFTRLLALPREVRDGADVTSLRLVAHTGAACPAQVKRAMIDWFGPVLTESYGGSELGTVARITSEEWLSHPGSVGRAVPPLEIHAYADAEPLPAGEIGLLGVSLNDGREVHFVGDPDKTRDAYVRPGVATLGDVGYVDPDGFVYITDRVSDMVISGGVNLYPAECEQVLQRHPDVEEVAVIGVPDPDLGEALHALVVARDPAAPPDETSLDAWCRSELAGYKCPKSYATIEALPRNEMGKVDKKSLRKQYAAVLS